MTTEFDPHGIIAADLAKLVNELETHGNILCAATYEDLPWYEYGGGRSKRDLARLLRRASKTIGTLYTEASK